MTKKSINLSKTFDITMLTLVGWGVWAITSSNLGLTTIFIYTFLISMALALVFIYTERKTEVIFDRWVFVRLVAPDVIKDIDKNNGLFMQAVSWLGINYLLLGFATLFMPYILALKIKHLVKI